MNTHAAEILAKMTAELCPPSVQGRLLHLYLQLFCLRLHQTILGRDHVSGGVKRGASAFICYYFYYFFTFYFQFS